MNLLPKVKWLTRSGAEDVLKFVVYSCVGIPAVALALRVTGVLPSSYVLPTVTMSQGACAALLALYGACLGVAISALTFGRKAADRRVEDASDRWDGCVVKLEDTLLKARFGDLWLSHPWDYVGYLEGVDRTYRAANQHGHLSEITLYGSMVGFSFLLPGAICSHIKRANGQFSKLRLLGSNTETKLSNQHNNEELSRFPLYLVAQLTEQLFTIDQQFSNLLRSGKRLSIQICFLEHDMLSAAIHCRGVEAATLQALDSALFKRIIKGEQAQPGFRYPNTTHVDAFDRVQAVLDNVARHFADDGVPNGTKRKCEVWEFSKNNAEPFLKIKNPHWNVDDKQRASRVDVIKGQRYYASSDECLEYTGVTNILSVVGLLLSSLRNLQPIMELEPLVNEYKTDDWLKSRSFSVTSQQAAIAP